ncbi:MAG: flagellar hook capping FlgD N-terminal domain-containing protein, partial [Acidiferrobacterales bacterium]
MSSISELFGSTTGTNTQTTTKEKGDIGQGDFLKLMMTQLRNQDPFKPLDSGEFLSQIAQFSTVS